MGRIANPSHRQGIDGPKKALGIGAGNWPDGVEADWTNQPEEPSDVNVTVYSRGPVEVSMVTPQT